MRDPEGMVGNLRVVVLGATATGKTSLACALARRFSGEIVSADSRQVYRGLDLGSGKDLSEYGDIPYHLIDVASLPGEYNVYSYQRDAYAAIADVLSRGRLPIVTGGTGLYIDSVVRAYRFADAPVNSSLRSELDRLSLGELAERLVATGAKTHNTTDFEDRDRLVRAIEIAEAASGEAASADPVSPGSSPPDLDTLVIGIRYPRPELRDRIRARLAERIRQGMVDEVRSLHAGGVSWERLERLGLEYRFTAEYLQGKIPTEREFFEGLCTAICRFAKRQETWFRGMERKGVGINWIDGADAETAAGLVSGRRPSCKEENRRDLRDREGRGLFHF